ncbi:MAG TPA: AAA domain-containing protein [Candidatus Fermentibacter daniensis]|nr:AAA domain-containing protein [Candidatus Fermentibacter daniensis]
MRFSDIPTSILTIRVKRTDSYDTALEEQPVFSIVPCPSRPGEFEVGLKGSMAIFKPVRDVDGRRLNAELQGGRAVNIAQLANPVADGSIEVQIALFTGECVLMGDVDVGIDEYTERRYAKLFKSDISRERPFNALTEKCCYTHGDKPYFFFLAGPAVERILRTAVDEAGDSYGEHDDREDRAPDEGSDPDGDSADSAPELPGNRHAATHKNSICIVGKGFRFIATETVRPDGDSIFIVSGLTKASNQPDRAIHLARGRLTFSDWTKTGGIRILAKEQMRELGQDVGSYLKKWDEFVNIEGELLLQHAREFGAVRYDGMISHRDGKVSVRIEDASESALKALSRKLVESVEVIDDIPEYLTNPELTFEQFTGSIEKEEQDKALSKGKKGKKEQRQYYDVDGFDPETKELTLWTENLPTSGTLILSLVGQIAQIKRRLYARRSIREDRAANPQLRILLDERCKLESIRSPGRVKPLTAFVVGKVFPDNPPTEIQRSAIEIALNTPDIALIQGPPGTGKTTVIAAIIERLNELADKRGSGIKGSVLLTGFQHDTVETMIGRLSLNGLPVPKFGGRSGRGEDDYDAFRYKLDEWCASTAMALREKNPQLKEIEQEAGIKNLCLQYLEAPTHALALSLAQEVSKLGILILGEECARHASYLVKKLSQKEQLGDESEKLLIAVRQLRHRPESFADDGPEKAAFALDELTDVLEPHERDCLDRASLWREEDGPPPFLAELATLKKRLLTLLTAPPVFRVEKHDEEVVALAEEAMKRIRTAGSSTRDRRTAALFEFLTELESNPNGMINAVSDYAYAFAATCQQSVGGLMQKQKGIQRVESAEEFQKIEYEYVIVDEAARVTPPDLMIAMAQGKRVILVGDHRQLPHIVDNDVLSKLAGGAEEELLKRESGIERDEENWSRISLFEHMFINRLPALEKDDGIPRRVTLDTQYRMHPTLGDFVSRNFYQRFDKSEAFRSGRPASDFAHALPGTGGKPAIWLDVPGGMGMQRRSGTSLIRLAEAIAITSQLREWMESEEGHALSFGVISFYKDQSELIKRHLGKVPPDEQRRLRIGTVDSFQGMEFDVVFLSMVRSMPDGWEACSDNEELQARRLFGHLCLYNRLNVAMSRQKKLLVVAGDSGLLSTELAARHIPGLVNFYLLCRTEGRVLPCH